jgi:beta-glucosidase
VRKDKSRLRKKGGSMKEGKRSMVKGWMLAVAAGTMIAASADPASMPWLDTSKPADQRAAAAVAAMTLDEKLTMILSYSEPDTLDKAPDDVVPAAVKKEVREKMIPASAGYLPGIPRLNIPGQWFTDASIGVHTDQGHTALPSSLTQAASFDPSVAETGGKMVASEARLSGFNILLAGGVNLAREPRTGRNFEYVGEDPLLAGEMGGAAINGIQSMKILSTIKHFAVNTIETHRKTINTTISTEAMRQSDLLAFELAIEKGNPGSVMCSYNLINGFWGCENDYLLNHVLKRDWKYKGYVMADWGAVHSTVDAANYGLDQFTGYPCCGMPINEPHYSPKLFKPALASGQIPMARLDDMVKRILVGLYGSGAFDTLPEKGKIDFDKNIAISQNAAEQSLVLLKNEGNLLPLKGAKTIAVIGGHADKGVISGGGSANVMAVGGNAVPGVEPINWPGPVVFHPSAPVTELKKELPGAAISYDEGTDIARAVEAAKKADVAIVFVTKFNTEAIDGVLELDGNQDALVAAVAKANPNTVVVTETGAAIYMPWIANVKAVLGAFYPGSAGGKAIARILTGKVNPSGHLPISFPASADQLAHPVIPGLDVPDSMSSDPKYATAITHDEGAAFGYKWYDVKGFKPLFAFGHGLSYTQFATSDLKTALDGDKLTVSFVIKNTGKLAGKAVPQIYLSPADYKAAGWEAPKRLIGFSKVALKPGEKRTVKLTVDPRLMAIYQTSANSWQIKEGSYNVLLGQASDALTETAAVRLPAKVWSAVQTN